MKRKLISILLILAMVTTLAPVSVFAEGEPAAVTEEAEPTASPEPTAEPTQAPTPEPTQAPTPEPTAVPTEAPEPEPAAVPAEEPAPEVPAAPAEDPAPENAEAPAPALEKKAEPETGTAAPEPVKVEFRLDPDGAKLTVFTKDEKGNKYEIRPEKDGSFLLLPGRYFYTLEAERYEAIEEKEFEVKASAKPMEVVLAVVPAAEPAEEDKDVPVAEDIEETAVPVPEEAGEPAEKPAPTEAEEESAAPVEEETPDETEEPTPEEAEPELTEEAGEAETAEESEEEEDEGEADAVEETEEGGTTSNESALATIASGTCGTNATWTLSDAGALVISGSGNMNGYSYYSQPWYSYKDMITKVTISSGVTSVGSYSFYNYTGITSVSIASSVTSIGSYAFYGCSGFSSVTLPSNLTTLYSSALYGCSKLTSITIPAKVTSFGSSCFANCTSLATVRINSGVTSIGSSAFSGCTKLTSVTIPASVTSIGASAFSGCSLLASITIPYGVTSIGNSAFSGCSKLTALTLPNSLTSIGNSAFSNCSAVTSITIPDSVKTIGATAFSGCSSLPSVTIPSSVTSIGDGAFSGCTALTSISVNSSNTAYSSSDNILFSKNKDTLIFYPPAKTNTSYTIPSTVKTIGGYAFSGCSKLTSVTIPSNVTTIGAYAFQNCSGITGFSFPAGLTSIGDYAFSNCTGLTTATFTSGTTSIGSYAFDHCTSLKNLTLPSSLPSVNNYTFYYCSSLTNITLPSSVSSIGTCAFARCSGLTSISLPSGVASIGASAFTNCTKLTSIEIPAAVSVINGSTFYSCTSLQSVTLPKSISSVGQYAFYSCSRLTDVYYAGSALDKELITFNTSNQPLLNAEWHFNGTLPSGECGESLSWALAEDGTLTISGSGAMTDYTSAENLPWYKYRSQLKAVVIQNGATAIADSAFAGSTVLETVTIPASVETIGNNAFNGCSALSDVYFLGDLIEWEAVTIGSGNDPLEAAELHAEGCPHPEDRRVIDPAVAATCEQTGLTEGSHCAICGEVITAQQTVPALGHDWDEGTITTEPACTEPGIRTFTCRNDSSHTKTEAIPATGHTAVVDPAVPATCEETGLTEGSHCSVCNETLTAQQTVPALGHDWDEGTVTTEPSCTEPGVRSFTCKNDSTHTKTEAIPATGHTAVVDPAVPATCEETGLTEGSHCSVCNETLTAQQTVPALGHNWDEGTVTTEPSCTEPGIKTFTCRNDSSHTKTEAIPALGHTVAVDPAVAATCEDDGLTEGSHCSVCGEVLTAQEVIPATGHTEVVDPAVPATCEEAGLTGGSHCSVCDKVLTAQEVIPALGHTEVVDPAVPATCEEAGLTGGSHCSVCDKVLTAQEVIPALGHDWDEGTITTEPACTEPGIRTFTCRNDSSHTKTEAIPATGHTAVVDPAVPATCEETGLTEGSHCSVCNETLTAQQTVPALGHDWDEGTVTTEPSCTEPGVRSFTCKNDSTHTKTEAIPATGHTAVVDPAVPATCEETGLTEGSHCSLCDKVFTAQEVIPALGHTVVVDPAVPATCEEAGLTEGAHCSVCDKVLTAQEVIPALGHDWDEGKVTTEPSCTEPGVRTFTCNNDNSHTRTEAIPALGHTVVVDPAVPATCEETGLTEGSHCSVCNEVLTTQQTVPALGHTVVVDPAVAATCEEAGLTEGSHCSVCDKVFTAQEFIPALGHDWDEGTITTEPACTEPGVRTFTCKNDSTHTKTESIPALGHTAVVDPEVPATCEDTGLTEGSHCSVCGEVLTAQETIDALGHGWDEGTVTVEPTDTEPGVKTYTCTVCGETKTEEIPATGIHLSKTSLTLVASTREVIRLLNANNETLKATWTAENIWSARSDENVVSVSNGLITALSIGEAKVTATYKGKSVSATVTVLFKDAANSGDYYFKPVYWAAKNEITTGTSSTEFSPNNSCSRGQIVTFLWRASGSPEPTSMYNPFRDVKATDYYYKAVLWALENKITTGTSDTTFSPNSPCTRKQVVTFLWRANGSPEPTSTKNPFTDVKPSDYFYNAVLWAVEEGITTGTSTTTFAPNAACSRGQCVTFLWRAKGKPEP